MARTFLARSLHSAALMREFSATCIDRGFAESNLKTGDPRPFLIWKRWGTTNDRSSTALIITISLWWEESCSA